MAVARQSSRLLSSGAPDFQPSVPSCRGERLIYAVALVIFVAASTLTLYFNHSMAGAMRMAGNWSMSMMWMPMGGVLRSAAVFTLMWLAMMITMMLPSTMPMLLLYSRVMAFRAVTRSEGRGTGLRAQLEPINATSLVAGGYFLVWTLFGIVAYLAGLLISRTAMHSNPFSRAVPLTAGLALCLAGAYQLTPWKSACLKHCRDPLTLVAHHLARRRWGALELGIHHGASCAACCWGLMLIQLILGVMNLLVMITIALIIALEKMLSRGVCVARLSGAVAMIAGMAIAGRAIALR
jgi:predicted metal-binding membrane protein